MKEVVLEGPGKNALSTELMDRLILELQKADGAPVLLRGAGDTFCAGLNLKELLSLDARGMEAFLRKLEQMVEALYTYPGPLVAALNGHAIAGGAVVALCCDHIVATSLENTRTGLNEAALGLCFPPLTLAVVKERLPRRFLNEILLGAQLHSPSGALRVGLVDELAQDAVTVARERLAVLAGHPREPYAEIKADLRSRWVDAARDEARFQEVLPQWNHPSVKQRIEKVLGPKKEVSS